MSKLIYKLDDVEDVETVRKVQFSILSPESIIKSSVCEVTLPETYDGSNPKINGLFDPRMGVLDDGRTCPTDENDNTMCPGYFGHINLALPVFYYHFIPYIIKILRCVCFRCSNILIDKSNPMILNEIKKRTGKIRFNFVYDKSIASKNKKCQYNCGCHAIQPKKYIKLNSDKILDQSNIVQIVGEFDKAVLKSKETNIHQVFTPELCYNILKNITEEDVKLLGLSNKYSRPEWLICKVLPVPPPYVRPSVKQDNNMRAEDDLTRHLIQIIKQNNQLRQKITSGAEKKTINIYEGALQCLIASYIDNEIPKVPSLIDRSGRPYKTLKTRLKAKGGRMRGNIMGKRCDRSARTVISVDPNISIDQFGVPIKMAMNLTYPEIVNKYNITKMYDYVRNGPNKYPGAKFIRKLIENQEPRDYSLKYIDPTKIKLEYGDIVFRHLVDGDIALFNRQPSLHRMSMMAHRIKVVNDNTFRLNVTVTTPYNADFDGDEMNMHVPDSIQTRVELERLALVSTQIISPSHSTPIIKIVQDSAIGSYLFTKKDTRISGYDFNNLLMFLEFNDNRIDAPTDTVGKVKYWDGKQVFSKIIPELTLKMKNDSGENCYFENGVMKYGQLDKDLINKYLIGTIHSIYGNIECKNFLNSIQSLIIRWMVDQGFSIGFGDIVAPKKVREEVNNVIDKAISDVYELIGNINKGKDTINIDASMKKAYFETRVGKILGDGENDGRKIIENYIKENWSDNSLYSIIKSGSKGSMINIQQIMSAVGQQSIWGSRIGDDFTNRSLPHFPKFDESPSSRGFIKNSYAVGMTPVENFFHAKAGRTGLIDTAIRTAHSGYISRRLIKALEDMIVRHDYTVRNTQNNIVQLSYGGDAFDPTKIEKQSFKLLEYSNLQMGEEFKISDDINWKLIISSKAYSKLQTETERNNLLDNEFNYLMSSRTLLRETICKNLVLLNPTDIRAPFNLRRLIYNTIKKFDGSKISDLTPKYIIDSLQGLEDSILKFFKFDEQYTLLRMLIKVELSTKRCIIKYKLTKQMFDYIINHLKLKMYEAFVAPGENVGIVAAHSLGEPSTQMSIISSENVKIVYKKNTEKEYKYYNGAVSTFIDDIINDKENSIVELNEGSIEGKLSDESSYYIIGVNETEKTGWNKISHISRHMANGGLVKVTTKSGRTITTTLSHSHLTRKNNKVMPINGSDLKTGMRIPILKNIKYNLDVVSKVGDFNLTFELGWLIGVYLASEKIIRYDVSKYIDYFSTLGYEVELHNNKLKLVDDTLSDFIKTVCTDDKKIPQFTYTAPKEFQTGFLRGYCDQQGNVINNKRNKLLHIYSSNLSEVKDISILFNYFNIFTTIKTVKNTYYLTIINKYVNYYQEQIGTDNDSFNKELIEIINYNDRKNQHDVADYIDKIPAIGDLVAECGKKLQITNHSRIYGRWKSKESIGRRTLQKYINEFKEISIKQKINIDESIKYLEQAVQSDVVWDEIVSIDILDDPQEYVYDFTVPGNQTFMNDWGVLTHNTLNTFHFAGVGSQSVVVTQGVPRLDELLNNTSSANMKTPSMTIYLSDKLKNNKELSEELKYQFEYTQLRDIISQTELIYDGPKIETEEDEFLWTTFNLFNKILNVEEEKELSNWSLKLYFDKESILKKNINMNNIKDAILFNTVSDEYITSRISDNNSETLVLKLKLTMQEDDDIDFYKVIEKQILDITLRGIKNIKRVEMQEKNIVKYYPDGVAETQKEITLNTDGTNLLDIMCCDYIDKTRTTTNDINEIYKIFGIEGVRSKYIKEFTSIFESYHLLNRHIELLTDLMTYKGIIMVIRRHGINKSMERGPIAKASFEEINDIFLNAGIFAETDKCNGVSANVMMGQFVKTGTNFSDIILDEEKLLSNVYDDSENLELSMEDMESLEKKIDSTFNDEPIMDDDFEIGISASQLQETTSKKIKKIKVVVK